VSVESEPTGASAQSEPTSASVPTGASVQTDTAAPTVASVRAGRRPRDMVRAMVVLMLPVIAIVGLYRFLGHETPPTIDTADTYETARAAHDFDVLIPTGLSTKWHITSASYQDKTLRLGFVSPNNGQLRVVETGPITPTLYSDELGAGAHPTGTVEVNGATWQRFADGRPDENSLVLADSKRTVIVVGHSSDADLQGLAASLK
jgi:hypothetical protein